MPATSRRSAASQIWVVHPGEGLASRLEALPAEVRALDGWTGLDRAFRAGSRTADLLVVDPYLESPSAPSQALQRFMEGFPSTVVVAAIPDSADRPDDVRTLGEWGVSGVITEYDTSAYALRRRLDEARERSGLHAVLQALPESLAPDARLLLETALSTASRGGNVRQMAQSLRLTERTLQRRTERARLPAPRSLLRWMRLLLAARLLDDPARTVVSAALSAGYASDASLHRNFRFSGLPSPARLRRDGALLGAVRHLIQQLGLRDGG